jgi:hypothetical protein
MPAAGRSAWPVGRGLPWNAGGGAVGVAAGARLALLRLRACPTPRTARVLPWLRGGRAPAAFLGARARDGPGLGPEGRTRIVRLGLGQPAAIGVVGPPLLLVPQQPSLDQGQGGFRAPLAASRQPGRISGAPKTRAAAHRSAAHRRPRTVAVTLGQVPALPRSPRCRLRRGRPGAGSAAVAQGSAQPPGMRPTVGTFPCGWPWDAEARGTEGRRSA